MNRFLRAAAAVLLSSWISLFADRVYHLGNSLTNIYQRWIWCLVAKFLNTCHFYDQHEVLGAPCSYLYSHPDEGRDRLAPLVDYCATGKPATPAAGKWKQALGSQTYDHMIIQPFNESAQQAADAGNAHWDYARKKSPVGAAYQLCGDQWERKEHCLTLNVVQARIWQETAWEAVTGYARSGVNETAMANPSYAGREALSALSGSGVMASRYTLSGKRATGAASAGVLMVKLGNARAVVISVTEQGR